MKHLCLILFIVIHQLVFAQDKMEALGANLENFNYPFKVSYITLNLQGEQCKMAYMDVKPQKENGKVILLLHGKNFSGAYWGRTAKELAASGFRIIIPDQIGFGKSTKPYHLQYSFHLLASNTKALLDTLNISKTAVLGHSMGGMLAVRFALMYPGITEKLILENPIGLEDYKLFTPYKPVDWWFQNELKNTYASIKKYQLENYYGGEWKPEYDPWVVMLAGWTLSPDYTRIAWNAARTYDMIITQPVLYEFSQLQAPTMLIIGQRDRTALSRNLADEKIRETLGNYPLLGKRTAEAIKGAELVEIEHVGHLPHIEAFGKFIAPLKSFLLK